MKILSKIRCEVGWHNWDFTWFHKSKEDTTVVGYRATCKKCGTVMEQWYEDMKYRLKY